MNRVTIITIVSAALLATVCCQQPPPYSGEPSSGQAVAAGFVPMSADDHRPSATDASAANANVAYPETSSVQSRDYSGSSDFYGYNNYPASYGPPSTSYGLSGKPWCACVIMKLDEAKMKLDNLDKRADIRPDKNEKINFYLDKGFFIDEKKIVFKTT